MASPTPPDLLASVLAHDPARPLLTWYDDATGERVELSAATTMNWVAKSANLLQDGLAVEPGERVGLLLPLHWQTAVLLLAAWSVGAVVTFDAENADVVFAAQERLADATSAGAREVLGLSLLPMGARMRDAPAGVADYATEVPSHDDVFSPYTPIDPAAPALVVDGRDLTGADLGAEGLQAAQRWDLSHGDRVLSVLPYDRLDGLTAGLLAPLAVGCSVVLCANTDTGALAARARQERVTVSAGVDIEGVRRLT